ncbi:MAG: PKD domain-containing protein, partial [Anaerolineae bacterium]|nr:PKD domain-containing protein [Anaerolineae bacterium]
FFTATVTATKGAHTFTATTGVEVAEAIAGLAVVNDSPTVVSDTTTLTATVAAGSDVEFTWDLGDGTLTYGSVVRHVYPEKGRYTAVVTATNKVSVLTTTGPVYVGVNPEETTIYMPLVIQSATAYLNVETQIYLPLVTRLATGLSR